MPFKTRWLKELKKDGYLKKFIKKFDDKINSHTFVSSGTQVECYKSPSGKLIKVCPKQIKFYQCWDNFELEINNMVPFFMSIARVIYEDEHIIVYVQEKCKKIYKFGKHNPYIGLNILLLIIAMFKNNKIATDIGTNNIGLYENDVYLFDCHGLMTIDQELDYFRFAKNLYRYLKSYYPCTLEELQQILSDKDNCIKILVTKYFEPIYKQYAAQFNTTQQQLILNKINLLNIQFIK